LSWRRFNPTADTIGGLTADTRLVSFSIEKHVIGLEEPEIMVTINKGCLRPLFKAKEGLAGWGVAWLMVVGLLVAGCASAPEAPQLVYATRPASDIEQLLRTEADRWIGTPHRLGGVSRKGIDCSGLVMQMYKRLFGIRLPRTTSKQVLKGVAVGRGQLQPGDLVFFHPPRKARHVGIYLGGGEFVHTSSSKGVMISHMQESYWRQSFWQARRIL
jgi:probable lipoprotein NlpC